jgi:hypothetical protein
MSKGIVTLRPHEGDVPLHRRLTKEWLLRKGPVLTEERQQG